MDKLNVMIEMRQNVIKNKYPQWKTTQLEKIQGPTLTLIIICNNLFLSYA